MRNTHRIYSWSLAVGLLTIAACSQSNQPLPGYIEGEYTYLSSEITGTLVDLAVHRGQSVQRGQHLFTLDPQPELADLSNSRANINALQAEVDFAKLTYARQKDLYPHGATPKASVDQAKQDFLTKTEQLSGNKAIYTHSAWSLQQKTGTAPVSGFVFDTYYRLGETVESNHPVLALLAPENIKVLFYIPENQLSLVHIGDTIYFHCDGLNGRQAAHISYISPEAEYTPPVIYSKDTRYKLVYLIRADLPPAIALQYHPGQPIDVYLHHE